MKYELETCACVCGRAIYWDAAYGGYWAHLHSPSAAGEVTGHTVVTAHPAPLVARFITRYKRL